MSRPWRARISPPLERRLDRAGTIAAAVALSVIAMASFLVLPLLVDGAMQSLHYSDQQVGVLSSLVSVGVTVSAVVAGFWVRRVSWRLAASVALLGVLASAAVSMAF